MNRDRKILYSTVALFLCALLLAVFVDNGVLRRIVLTVICAALCAASIVLIKKRNIHQKEKYQLSWLLPIISLIALAVYFFLGFFFRFAKLSLSWEHILKYVLLFAIIISLSELARSVLLAQKGRTVRILSYFAFVILDTLMLTDGSVLSSFTNFVNFMGLILFPALTANLLYNFVSVRYGALPVIIYKIIMLSYGYIIPVKPLLPNAMLAFIRLLFPLVVLLFVQTLYERKHSVVSKQNVYVRAATTGVMLVGMVLIVMLISCRFQYGMIVIASESMSGAIEKGDAIIYRQYEDGEIIEEGQVLVYQKNGITEVHRVIEIENVNGELRYYTKGDANEKADSGYITSKEIVGLTDITIKYIGQPTLWVRQIIK